MPFFFALHNTAATPLTKQLTHVASSNSCVRSTLLASVHTTRSEFLYMQVLDVATGTVTRTLPGVSPSMPYHWPTLPAALSHHPMIPVINTSAESSECA